MEGLTVNFQVLIVISVMFVISLGGAFVLFRILDSQASIQRAGYKAGGALAGFLIILSMLFGSYYKLVQAQDSVGYWTIVGKCQAPHLSRDEMIEVHIIPPAPRDLLPLTGSDFRLENVRLTQKQVSDGIWPELEFFADGLLTKTILLTEEDVEVDAVRRRLVIKKPILLQSAVSSTEFRNLEDHLADAEPDLRADAGSAIGK